MAYNDRKILQVLQKELEKVDERCPEYREELSHLLGDVLNFEREHSISKTPIVKKIADQVNTVGMFLYRERLKAGDDSRERR